MNKDHPDIKEMIPVKGCPPSIEDVKQAFSQIGIELPGSMLDNMTKAGAGFLMAKYKDRPEFEESFFQIS